jgi:hypothetical protein
MRWEDEVGKGKDRLLLRVRTAFLSSNLLFFFRLEKKKDHSEPYPPHNIRRQQHQQHKMASIANAVVPGQRLGHVQEYSAGPGTYSHQDFLYASVVGIKKIIESQGEVLRFF